MASGLAAGCRDWCDAAECGEGSLGADSVGVVAGGDEQLGGGLVADAFDGDRLRAGPFDEGSQLGVEVGDLAGERLVAARQGAQSGADRDLGVGGVAGGAPACRLAPARRERVRAAGRARRPGR